jgi:hypothetical protein
MYMHQYGPVTVDPVSLFQYLDKFAFEEIWYDLMIFLSFMWCMASFTAAVNSDVFAEVEQISTTRQDGPVVVLDFST